MLRLPKAQAAWKAGWLIFVFVFIVLLLASALAWHKGLCAGEKIRRQPAPEPAPGPAPDPHGLDIDIIDPMLLVPTE